jgi:hypothetical protein
MTRLLIICLFMAHFGAAFAQTKHAPLQLVESELQFDTDRHELTEAHKTQLQATMTGLTAAQRKQCQFEITGHTDARGSAEYNYDLSMRRARSVADFLTAFDVEMSQIALIAEGESAPTDENATDSGMQRNRRVTLRVVAPQKVTFEPTNLVPQMRVGFMAERGLKFQHPKNGTTVTIPPNALANADGTPAKGPCSLVYREWRHWYELLSFGQTMNYHDSRGEFAFNSNGMFEVRVMQKDAPLGLLSGKTAEVSFIENQAMPDVNLYQFNDQTGQWALQNPTQTPNVVDLDQVINANTQVFGSSVCYPMQLEFWLPDLEGKPYANQPGIVPDSIKSAHIAHAAEAGVSIAKGEWKIPIELINDPYAKDTIVMAQLAKGQIKLPYYQDGGTFFYLDDTKNTFPELEVYKNYLFEYVPSINGDVFTELQHKVTWSAIYIAFASDVDNLHDMTLVSSEYKIRVKVRLLGKGLLPTEQAVNDQLFAEYTKIRKTNWEDVLEFRKFISMSPLFRTESEFCMSASQWLAHFMKNKPAMLERFQKHVAANYQQDWITTQQIIASYDKRSKDMRARYINEQLQNVRRTDALYTVLSINAFGIYNCDQLARLGTNTRSIVAQFKTQDGTTVQPMVTNVVSKGAKLMLQTSRPNVVYINSRLPLDVVVTDKAGKFYVMRAEDFAKAQPVDNTVQLVLEDVSEQVKTARDWIKVLGI